MEYATGTRKLKELGGLNRALPVTGATSLIGSMSIAGVPPFNGFWSKLIIILACVESEYYGFAAVAVAVSVVWLASPAAIVKGLICILFILITSAMAAYALARAAHRSGAALCDQSVVDRYADDRQTDDAKIQT